MINRHILSDNSFLITVKIYRAKIFKQFNTLQSFLKSPKKKKYRNFIFTHRIDFFLYPFVYLLILIFV